MNAIINYNIYFKGDWEEVLVWRQEINEVISEIGFEHTINEEETLFFPISTIPALCTAHKNDIEISDKQNTWYFYINEKQMTVQMDIAATLLHKAANTNS